MRAHVTFGDDPGTAAEFMQPQFMVHTGGILAIIDIVDVGLIACVRGRAIHQIGGSEVLKLAAVPASAIGALNTQFLFPLMPSGPRAHAGFVEQFARFETV